MKPLLFHPEATAETDEAVGYYEQQKPGLGIDLRMAVELATRRIQKTPERWPPLTKLTRRFHLRRFPYAVVYAIHPACIFIVALAHDKRKPGYWKNRI